MCFLLDEKSVRACRHSCLRVLTNWNISTIFIVTFKKKNVCEMRWICDSAHKLLISFICMCLVAKLCLTLCYPMDCNLPGSSVYGIFQARIVEWIAISLCRGSSQPRDWICTSCIGKQILYQWATWEAFLYIDID